MSTTKPKLCVSISSTEHPHTARQENHFLPYNALFLSPNYGSNLINAYLITSRGAKRHSVDTSRLKSFFLELKETNDIRYITSTIEWTNAHTVEILIKLTIDALKPYTIPIVHMHIGDTHHGKNAISTPLRVLKELDNEINIITCNQYHHMHFFASTKYSSSVNIPKISPYSRHLFQLVSSSNIEEDEQDKIWFGAIESRFHHRRNKFLNYIRDNSGINKKFTMKRFGKYEERISQIMSTDSSLYIPLSSSIGFNNVAPSYIIGKPVWQYPLSRYTGQQKLSEIFNHKVNFIREPSDLMYISKRKIEKQQLKANVRRGQRIYENEITMTFSQFVQICSEDKEKKDIMEPKYWDMRYEELIRMSKEISESEKNKIIEIYEIMQTRIEKNCKLSVKVLFPDQIVSKEIEKLHKYGRLVFSDLAHKVKIEEYQYSGKKNTEEIDSNEQLREIVSEFELGGYKIYFQLS